MHPKSIEIKDNRMKISLSNAALADDIRELLRNEIQDKLGGIEGIDVVAVDYEDNKPLDVNQVGKIIAVMSGKGGVGNH